MVDAWPDTFLSRDPRKGTSLIAPRGKSPVLFGLRATSRETAERGCQRLPEGSGTEQVDRWRVFQTNQASGDHLGPELTLTVERLRFIRPVNTLRCCAGMSRSVPTPKGVRSTLLLAGSWLVMKSQSQASRMPTVCLMRSD